MEESYSQRLYRKITSTDGLETSQVRQIRAEREEWRQATQRRQALLRTVTSRLQRIAKILSNKQNQTQPLDQPEELNTETPQVDPADLWLLETVVHPVVPQIHTENSTETFRIHLLPVQEDELETLENVHEFDNGTHPLEWVDGAINAHILEHRMDPVRLEMSNSTLCWLQLHNIYQYVTLAKTVEFRINPYLQNDQIKSISHRRKQPAHDHNHEHA